MPTKLTPRQIMDRQVKEVDFQQSVIELAHCFRWTVAHFRPAKVGEEDDEGKQRWVTPVQADGAGFPDLILIRGYQGVTSELKTEKGKLTPEQRMWLRLFHFAGFRVAVWRPRDWDKIERILR